MENQNLYCHWDTHNSENVLFNSLNDLDSHIRSHYQEEQVQESQEQVACHWDSCHEMINLDEMWSHFKSFHFKDLQTPHDGCDPCGPDGQQHSHEGNAHSHSHSHPHSHSHSHHDSNYTEHNHPQPQPYVWGTPQPAIPSLSDPNLPTLGSIPIKSEQALKPCTCEWEMEDGNCCNQVFPNSHELNAHISSTHVGRGCHDYVCKWKGCKRDCRPFIQRQKLVRHLQTHAKNWSYKCHICGHLSNDDMSLKQHIRTHSGEKPHVCKICGKRFTAMSSLTVHLRVHTGEKPLKCKFPGCNKRFSESSNLNKHMKTHLSRSFECPNCNRKFCRRDQLQRHVNLAHPENTNPHYHPNKGIPQLPSDPSVKAAQNPQPLQVYE